MVMYLFNYNMFWLYFLIMGYLSCVMYRSHLLSIFVVLEFLSIMLSWGIIYYFSFFSINLFYCFFFLVFSVCEACFGLSILVNFIRLYGMDGCFILSFID